MRYIGIHDGNPDTGFGEQLPLHKVLPALGDLRPLSVATQKLREQMEDRQAVSCPCCGQLAKLYPRVLGASMAQGLILLYHEFNAMKTPGPLHITETFQRLGRAHGVPASAMGGGDVAKLRYWQLLKRVMGQRDDGSNRVGLYTMTDLGRKFVLGKVKVPSHAYVYNTVLVGWSDTVVDIQQALGKKFSYRELMRLG